MQVLIGQQEIVLAYNSLLNHNLFLHFSFVYGLKQTKNYVLISEF